MIFVNPTGTLIPHPERFGLEPGARIIFGTDDADTFIFNDGPFTGGVQHVVIGKQGSDEFFAPNNLGEDRYYSGYLRPSFWALLGDGTPWKADDKRGWTHVGPNDEAKGINRVLSHGGHYGEGNEATIWAGPGSAPKVYIPGDEIYEHDTVRFIRGTIARDSDGHGWTAQLSSLEIENSTPDNPITDQQELLLRAANPRNGTNWHPTYVDFDNRHGPTDAEMQHFVEHWGALV